LNKDSSVSTVTKEGAPRGKRGGQQPPEISLPALATRDLWHSSAPPEVRSAWPKDAEGEAWQAWQKWLGGRSPLQLANVAPLKAAAWAGDSAGDSAGELAGFLRRLEKCLTKKSTPKPTAKTAAKTEKQSADEAWIEKQAEAWIDASLAEGILTGGNSSANVEFALQTLAWVYAAPAAAARLASGQWWRLVEQLQAIMQIASKMSPGEDASADAALVHQLLAGEASLAIGTLLPEIRPLRSLRKRGVQTLTEGLLALTDGEGQPPARCLPRLAALLACWTRCRAIAEQSGKPCWDKQAETQYEWFVRHALRLARPDGTFALTSSPAASPALFAAALELGGDDGDHAAAAKRLRPKPAGSSDEQDSPPSPSVNSEWSGLAVLAAGWKPKSPRLTVAYEGHEMQIELASGGQIVLSGTWPVDVVMEGAPVAADGEWEEQCWFCDDDSDYLELSIDLENGAKLERQIFMAREDGVAYVSEILLSGVDQPGGMEINTRLPLGEQLSFEPTRETREGWLTVGDKKGVGVVPLALPEWRVDPRGGELTMDEGALVLSQVAVGRNLCSPLMLDFKPRRFTKQRTWRQLTVASHLEPVDPDVAVGYRFQSGKQQWVIYRSLDPAANRSLIGQNYSSESFIGRFLPTGEVEEYWEVEADRD